MLTKDEKYMFFNDIFVVTGPWKVDNIHILNVSICLRREYVVIKNLQKTTTKKQ